MILDLQKAFSYLDTTGDGEINELELQDGIDEYYKDSPKTAREIFSKID